MSGEKQIKIIEVGPRDGLQNEKKAIDVQDKITFIDLLSQCGFPEIEAGAFVSPKWVPQMASSEDIFQHLQHKSQQGMTYSALVPNLKGMEKALELGVQKICVFTAASATFNQKNINCTIQESIARFVPVVDLANQNDVKSGLMCRRPLFARMKGMCLLIKCCLLCSN